MDVAVVGLACRAPGTATDGDQLWELLMDGRCTASEPGNRFNIDGFHHSKKGRLNTIYPRKAHFMTTNIGAFDAPFFGISPGEAKAMDPQQRMMLEVTYEAFEDAGIPIESLAGSKTSSYVGVSNRDYRETQYRDPDGALRYTLAGTGDEILSNRVSWFFDLRGPSFTVETACSASLVALHQACQSLRSGGSTMAVVGGVNLLLNPEMFQFLSNQGFLAPDGLCKAFDASGNGYGRGEGVIAIVLKPASAAIRDQDNIRAVIRGSGVNQDGKTPGGITVPSSEAQRTLIASTYASAGLSYEDTGYFEAHGTGTAKGDPIEVSAIAQTITQARDPQRPLFIGSVKTNIGHLEAASGLAGLVKSIYILEKGIIPASLHFKDPNPEIPFSDWKIKVPTKNVIWPAGKSSIRRISVNSFGFGGTNAHVIVDDAKSYLASKTQPRQTNGLTCNGYASSVADDDTKDAPTRIFMLSAADQNALSKMREQLYHWLDERVPDELINADDLHDVLEQSAESFLRDLALTLSEKKSRLPWRCSLLARSIPELKQRFISSQCEAFRSRANIRIGFVFTGQGAQWARMGLALMRYPIFRKSVEDADSYLRLELGTTWSAIEELSRHEGDSRLDDPELSQSICTVLQIALVDLLAAWCVKPSVVIGHSSGEIGAAYCLGVLDRNDALRIAYFRGHLSSKLQAAQGGSSEYGMLAVGASQSDAESHIRDTETSGEVVVACINSAMSVTLSGLSSGIDLVSASLTKKSIFNRKLRVKMAYHSPQMDLIAKEYSDAIRRITPRTPLKNVRMFSSVTGSLVEPGELGYSNWVQNLVSPVCFKQAVESLLRSGRGDSLGSELASVDLLLEIGPHCALQSPVQEILGQLDISEVQYESVLRRGKNAFDTAVGLAGRLVAIGVPVDLVQVHSDASTMHMDDFKFISDLPKYPWNHSKTYWAETRLTRQHKHRTTARNRLLGAPFAPTSGSEVVWRNFLRFSEEPWLRDHRIQGNVVFPAAGFIAIAIEGAKQMMQKKMWHCTLRDVQIVSALLPSEEEDVEIVLQIRRRRMGTRGGNNSSWYDFSISSSVGSKDLKENCRGSIKPESEVERLASVLLEAEIADKRSHNEYLSAKSTCGDIEEVDGFYDMLSNRGLFFGPSFQRLLSLTSGPRMRCFEVRVPPMETVEDGDDVIHTTTLDSILQSWNPSAANNAMMSGRTVIPSSFDEIVISGDISSVAGGCMKGWSSWATQGLDKFRAEIAVMSTESQRILLKVSGMNLISLDNLISTDRRSNTDTVFSSRVQWDPVLLDETGLHEKHHPNGECLPNGELTQATVTNSYEFEPLNLDTVTIIELSRAPDFACHLTTQLQSYFDRQGITSDSVRWDDDDVKWEKGRIYVATLEIDHAFLAHLNERDWQRLKSLFTQASNVLWLVKNATPDAGAVLGLARVVRNELGMLDLRTLRITQDKCSNGLVQLVGKLALHSTRHHEFRELNGNLEVSRIIPLDDLGKRVTGDTNRSEELVTLDAFPMKLSVQQPGLLDSLCFEPDYDYATPLDPEDIEIDVKATGLNFREVMVALGQIPDVTLGFEAAGIVNKTGTDVTQFNIGDAVCAMSPGAQRTKFRVNQLLCQHVPSGISMSQAATLGVVHCTAYHALVHTAQIQRKRSILIHAAAGGVGQAAVQLAQHYELEIFATVGSPEKRDLLQQLYSIPEDHIFNSRDLSFVQGVMRMTIGRGVDYVLNSLSGEALNASWTCIAPFGKFIEIGIQDILNNAPLDMRPFLQDASFAFLNLANVAEKDPQTLSKTMKSTFDLLRNGITRPVEPLEVFDVSQAEKAFRLMQSGKHIGKIALEYRPDLQVKVNARPPPHLDEHSTYVIAGGLGGLGRSLCKLLVDLKARHICILSRSGAKSTHAVSLLEALHNRGVQVRSYQCDIADPESLRLALQQCSIEMPPIKGVIQSAMILRDVLIEEMTHQDWTDSLRPKVAGTWNLHEQLSHDPNIFFIILSTFAGMFGNHGQANYAAGSTYQDELAHYRRSKGLKAVSIDLGAMTDVGVIAETGAKGHFKVWNKHFGIKESEFLALLREVLRDQLDSSSALASEPQIVTGFATGGAARRAGIPPPFYLTDPRFEILQGIGLDDTEAGQNDSSSGSNESLRQQALDQTSIEGAANVVLEAMVARVAVTLQIDIKEVEPEASLPQHGVDSLLAVELRNWFAKEFATSMTTLELLSDASIKALATTVAKALRAT